MTMEASKPKSRIPRKQLTALALCRFAQPFAIVSSYPYLPEYIEWQGVPPVNVAVWLGIFAASFSTFQAGCALPWAYASDHYGRKTTVLISQCLSMIACIGIGFSQSTWLAAICIGLAGAGNGNIGVLRTMVAEIVPQKELQTTAFTILPTVAAFGTILGPLLGGNLANPVRNYPQHFADNALFTKYPFALPNCLIGIVFIPGMLATVMILEETLRPERTTVEQQKARVEESIGLMSQDGPNHDVEDEADGESHPEVRDETRAYQSRKVSLGHLRNSYLWINAALAFHSSGFDNIIPVFLHLPYQDVSGSLLNFASGFDKSSAYIGAVLTTCGIFAMAATLVLYPRLARRFGQVTSLRASSYLFPMVYFAIPFSVMARPRWLGEGFLMSFIFLKIMSTVTLTQCCLLLLSNSVTPADLATLNGLNVTVTSICRGIGAAVVGAAFSVGMAHGYVIVPFWILALLAVVGVILAAGVKRQ